MATTRQPTALAQLEQQEQIMLGFQTHFVEVKAFEDELIARTGTTPFAIANTVVWDAMLASRDLLVIQFASWIRGLYKPGGMLGLLCAHHLAELRAAFDASRIEQPRPGRDPRSEQIDARFPGAVERGRLDPADFEALRNAVQTEFRPVVDDRDSFRAHPYERGQKVTARLLALDEIEPMLRSAQALLNDLRLLIDNSTLGYSHLSMTNPREAAADLIDLLLFGSALHFATIIGANGNGESTPYFWERREAFLAALREEHTARPDLALNDDAVIDAARSRIGTALSDA